MSRKNKNSLKSDSKYYIAKISDKKTIKIKKSEFKSEKDFKNYVNTEAYNFSPEIYDHRVKNVRKKSTFYGILSKRVYGNGYQYMRVIAHAEYNGKDYIAFSDAIKENRVNEKIRLDEGKKQAMYRIQMQILNDNSKTYRLDYTEEEVEKIERKGREIYIDYEYEYFVDK